MTRLFVLHRDPVVAASLHTDRDVLQRCLVMPQVLTTAHQCHDGVTRTEGRNQWFLTLNNREVVPPLSPTLPLVKWTGATWGNYRWMREHFKGFLREYQKRWGVEKDKIHKGWKLLEALSEPPRRLKAAFLDDPWRMTTFPTELYVVGEWEDVVETHQRLYRSSRVSANRPIEQDYKLEVPSFMLFNDYPSKEK